MIAATSAVTPIAPIDRVRTHIHVQVADGERTMRCPRCTRTALVERLRGRVAIDVCSLCGGIWLDRGELHALIAQNQGYA